MSGVQSTQVTHELLKTDVNCSHENVLQLTA